VSAPDLSLVLPAQAENVGVVRHALGGLAEALGMDPARIGDLKTIATEACTNAVVHAYADGQGPMEIDASRDDDSLVVTVRDHGDGIRPRADIERQSLRMGLPLIGALADSFQIGGGPGRGTVVTMRMGLSADGHEPPGAPEVETTIGAMVSMPAGSLVAPVLSRVISSFAVRADFSVDRLSDAILLGDAVAAQAPEHFPDGTAKIAVDERDGTIAVRVGPLREGAGESLLEGMRIPQIDASLERLADQIRVETEADSEHLLLELTARSG